jgi:cytochrome c biogenesis protein CcdA
LIPITAAIILVMGLIMIIDYDYSWFSRPLKDNSNKFIAKISPLVVVPVTAVIRIMKRDKDFNFNSELQGEGLWGQFGYGVGYGAASAGCTAPIFIALLFASMEYSFLGAAFIFTLYAFSTAALMVSFTVLVAASQNTLVNRMKASTGQIKKVGGVVLLLVGAYLMYEYFTTWAL